MEEFTVPFLHDRGRPVESDREKAEILAKAFNDSAGSYFPEYKRLGEEIRSAKNKFYAALGIAILLLVVGVIYELYILIGTLLLAAVSAYFYNIKNKKQTTRMNLMPAQNISFLSKMHIPVYIVPYSSEKSLVIDSRGMGESVQVDLENYDMDSLISSLEEFEGALEGYYELIDQKEMLDPETVEEHDEEIMKDKLIEKNLLTALNKIVDSSSPEAWEKNSFQLDVHKPESNFTKDLKYLYDYKENSEVNYHTNIQQFDYDSDIPCFDIFTDSKEAIEKVNELKGMEARASSSDIIDKTREWKNSISDILKDIEMNLENNIEIADSSYTKLNSLNTGLVNTQVCPKCLSSKENDDSGPTRGQPAEDYFNLEKYILNEFETPINNMDDNVRCGECNTVVEAIDRETIRCPECSSETVKYKSPEGSPRNKAEKYIRNNIEVKLDDIPMKYIFDLPVCSKEEGKWYCDKHGEVEPISLPAFGDVLAPTAEKTWDEMKEPIKEQCGKAKEKAMEHLNQYRSQMLQVATYEQAEIELESLISQINGDIRSARTAMKKLGWGGNVDHISKDESTEKIPGVRDALDKLGVK